MTTNHTDSEGEIEIISCSQCRSGKEHDQCQKDGSHTTDPQLSKCEVCQYETKKISYMRRHTELMHGANADVSNVLTCKSCEFETETNQSLQHHTTSALESKTIFLQFL